MFDRWDRLIAPNDSSWRFLRIEPLAPRSWGLLLGPDGVPENERREVGVKLSRRLPPADRDPLANPRNVEYFRKLENTPTPGRRSGPRRLADYSLRDLRKASHVFAGAADHTVTYGMTNPKARRLGRRKDRAAPEVATDRQVGFVLDLLRALTYTMCATLALGTKKGEPFRPNVSRVAADEMDGILHRVLKALKRAKRVPRGYDAGALDALAELNTAVNSDLLDTRPARHSEPTHVPRGRGPIPLQPAADERRDGGARVPPA